MPRGVAGRGAIVAAAGVMLFAEVGQAPAQTSGNEWAVGASRPIPYPVTPPARFRRAVEGATRTETGEPGPNYWQQYARYDIDVRIDLESKRLEGRSRIVYINNSPESLENLYVKLYQNLHSVGATRSYPQEVTGGTDLHRVVVDGVEHRVGRQEPGRYAVQGTVMTVWPPRPIAAGDSAVLQIDWGFAVPRAGASGRMGWNSDNFMYFAYWYPQMAVYDDVLGWHTDPFLGRGEFYAGFADYNVRVNVPVGWVVVGTGELENEEDVLPDEIRRRLRRAEASDDVVHVLTAEDFGPGGSTQTSESGRLTWHLRSGRVRDMAFSLSRESLWDATRTPVGDRDGDGLTDYARVDALYRETATRWRDAARYAQHSIDFLSRYLDFPYPWPHMTAVEGGGIIGGGMEYPMMTLIGSYDSAPTEAFYSVIAHELAHMWMPMIVSSDEVRWAWMDEGTTSFNGTEAEMEFYPGVEHEENQVGGYARAAGRGFDGTMMRWTDWEYPDSWGIAAYPKPAAALIALRSIIGEEVFNRAFRHYVRTWSYKHPKPWDLFNAFETASGRNLDWFWRGWFYEQWTLDHSVAGVETAGGATRVTIEDRGDLPMPAVVTLTRANGDSEVRTVGVEEWLSGARRATVEVAAGSPVVRVELDSGHDYPDVDRENDVWELSARAR